MSIELIYKTTSPAAIAWWLNAKAEFDAAFDRRREYEARMTAEFGLPQRESYQTPVNTRALYVNSTSATGLDSGYSEQPPADSGWRLDSKSKFWKPKLATKEGKVRASELAALKSFDHAGHAPEVGVPSIIFSDGYVRRPNFYFDEETNTLYQLWGSGTCMPQCEAEAAKVPGVVWEKVPRSQWYALVESKEAKEGEDD